MPDSFETQVNPPSTAEIRSALETMRPFMFPGLYDQLNAQLSARENQWPQEKPPPFAADDEDEEEPLAPQSTPEMVDAPIDFDAYRRMFGWDWPAGLRARRDTDEGRAEPGARDDA
jgi:hypothetical protein